MAGERIGKMTVLCSRKLINATILLLALSPKCSPSAAGNKACLHVYSSLLVATKRHLCELDSFLEQWTLCQRFCLTVYFPILNTTHPSKLYISFLFVRD